MAPRLRRGLQAIGITANFVNGKSAEESCLREFGVSSIYDRRFFDELAHR